MFILKTYINGHCYGCLDGFTRILYSKKPFFTLIKNCIKLGTKLQMSTQRNSALS